MKQTLTSTQSRQSHRMSPLQRYLRSIPSALLSLATITSSVSLAFSIQTDHSNHRPQNQALNSVTDPISATCPSSSTMASSLRTVRRVMKRPPTHWVGDGFLVYPVFDDVAFQQDVSPLLMFDYAAPKQFPPRPGKAPLGVGQHPHRGFETVTVAFQGEVEHHDSFGNTGIIKEGDVQWMTAGRGIVHQEYHSREFTDRGGIFEMCQLWVNLPKKDKMTEPHYQGIYNADIPVVNLPLGSNDSERIASARIIAGELGSTTGAAKTYSPVQLWDVIIPSADTVLDIPFPSNQNLIAFVRRGVIDVLSSNDGSEGTSRRLNPQDVALTNIDGSDTLRIRTYEADTSVLILGGEPLNEPIAARGPFVMNTQDEIRQAFYDYQAGKLGS